MPSPTPSSTLTTRYSNSASPSLRRRTRSWLRNMLSHFPGSSSSSSPHSNTSPTVTSLTRSSSTFTPSSLFSFPLSGGNGGVDKGKGKQRRVHKGLGDGYWGLESDTGSEESLEREGAGIVGGGGGARGGVGHGGAVGRDWVPRTAL